MRNRRLYRIISDVLHSSLDQSEGLSEGLSEELESLVHASDLLYASPDDLTRMIGILPWWDEVWSAQQLDGAVEVYACCCPAADLRDGGMAQSSAMGGSVADDDEDEDATDEARAFCGCGPFERIERCIRTQVFAGDHVRLLAHRKTCNALLSYQAT